MKKVILLTGGTRGIGRAILETLLKNTSYCIAFLYKDSDDLAKEIKQQYGNRVFPFKGNLENTSCLKTFVAKAYEKWGQIDGLINNASVSIEGLLETTSSQAIDDCLNTNIRGTLHLTKNTIAFLRQSNNAPFILNISSIWGMKGASCESVYAMTKGALNQLTASLACELGPCQIRTMGIAPGYIKTDMTNHYTDEDTNCFLKEVPLKRVGLPEEIAALTQFMIEKGTYLNGITIPIDGGYGI